MDFLFFLGLPRPTLGFETFSGYPLMIFSWLKDPMSLVYSSMLVSLGGDHSL